MTQASWKSQIKCEEVSVCLFSVSQQLYQLRNWSGGVPLTPELEQGKLFLFTLTSYCHRNTAGSWPSSLHATHSPPETRPAATANYHSFGENENAIKHHRRASWPALAKSLLWLVQKKRGANKGLWEWRIPLFGKLTPIGSLSQVDRFIRPAVKCWLVHSHGTNLSRHVGRGTRPPQFRWIKPCNYISDITWRSGSHSFTKCRDVKTLDSNTILKHSRSCQNCTKLEAVGTECTDVVISSSKSVLAVWTS